jgi:dihydrofolate reductase
MPHLTEQTEVAPVRTLSVNTFISLDGVMQGPGGPQEDPTGGFSHGGWNVTFWDDVMGSAMARAFAEPYDLLLGRRTYEIFAAHWPYVTDDPVADGLNAMTKYVTSRTLDQLSWQNSVLLPGDAGTTVAALKEREGPDLMVQGSSDLLQTLLAHDLVDRFSIWTFPVLLGRGKRLFGEGTIPGGLRLTESQTATTGVVIATYERAGAVPVGSFQLGEPSAAETRRRASLIG